MINKPKPTIGQVCNVLKISADKRYPESALWLGIVLQSIEDLKMYQPKKTKEIPTEKQLKNIRKQINTSKQNIEKSLIFHASDYFETVCDYAGLNVEYARRTINMLHTPAA